VGDQSITRPVTTQENIKQEKFGQNYVSRMRLEAMFPVFGLTEYYAQQTVGQI